MLYHPRLLSSGTWLVYDRLYAISSVEVRVQCIECAEIDASFEWRLSFHSDELTFVIATSCHPASSPITEQDVWQFQHTEPLKPASIGSDSFRLGDSYNIRDTLVSISSAGTPDREVKEASRRGCGALGTV